MDDIEIVDIKIPENNNQRLPIGTIIVFVCLILGIVLFFVYDRFFKKENIERSFNLNQEQFAMTYNQVYNLSNLIILTNLELSNLQVTSSDNNIITIDNYNLISGNIDGEVNITITYKTITKNLKVIVNDGVDRTPKLSFSKNNIDLNKNFSKNIYDYLNIRNLDKNEILFSSSNIEVADVIDGKIVTFEKDGIAIIKAKYYDLESEIKIVIGNKYLYFKEEEFVLVKNSRYSITDYIDSLNIEMSNIIYKVDDLSVLYITDGQINTRNKNGEAIITVTSGDLVSKTKIIVQ